ncbi:uncharacterized protein LOC121876725 [Homarus americanus]|uniref:uncharacterized protein LOC121876725 n=1 Tax=Homarus americanus TaxID=6706 RepID=UPI001C45169A|nr:uncharacterized protein LOC121876725 [Homarus americanus]
MEVVVVVKILCLLSVSYTASAEHNCSKWVTTGVDDTWSGHQFEAPVPTYLYFRGQESEAVTNLHIWYYKNHSEHFLTTQKLIYKISGNQVFHMATIRSQNHHNTTRAQLFINPQHQLLLGQGSLHSLIVTSNSTVLWRGCYQPDLYGTSPGATCTGTSPALAT